jgi:hypothetical protein
MLPLMGLTLIAILNWQQFLALFGLGTEHADFGISLRTGEPPWSYVLTMLSLVLIFELLPYLEELARGIRASRRAL